MVKHVVHVVGNLALSSGGPSHTISGLAKCLSANRSFNVSIASHAPRHGTSIDVDPSIRQIECQHTSAPRSLVEEPILRALGLLHLDKPIDAIISHGLWTPTNLQAVKFARRVGCPFVIQPHGMLAPWALNHHRYRKIMAGAFFQWRDLRDANALLATSEEEFHIFRSLGLRQPIMVSPNGIDRPSLVKNLPLKRPDKRVALFLGRLHPVKGIDNLLKAWFRIKPASWHLIIAGPDEGGHKSELKHLVDKLGLDDVIFHDPVFGDKKVQLLRQADIFILPSHTENFGVSVLEAMSFGLPVITTKGTPWREVVERRCGWWVESDAPSLADALGEATSLSRDELIKMGENAKIFSKKFEWNNVGSEVQKFMHWLINNGAKPSGLMI